MCKDQVSLEVHGFHTLVVTIGQFPATTKKIEVRSQIKDEPGYQEWVLMGIQGLKTDKLLLKCHFTLVLLAFFAGVVGVRWGGNG